MISHEAGFPALHMTDHVPFYTTLSCKRLHFPNTLFRIIFTENRTPLQAACDFDGWDFVTTSRFVGARPLRRAASAIGRAYIDNSRMEERADMGYYNLPCFFASFGRE
jgi:hypothetical protein